MIAQDWKFCTNSIYDKKYAQILSTNSDQDFELFVDMLIGSLGTLFATPEEELATQGDKSLSMSIIVSGNCFMS
jgi:hypothetical protein